MQRAQSRDALGREKFYFRKNLFGPGSSRTSSANSSGLSSPVDSGCECFDRKPKVMQNCFPDIPPPPRDYKAPRVHHEYEEMTIKEIMTGKVCIFSWITWCLVLTPQKDDDHPGLIVLVEDYLETLDLDVDSRSRLNQYLDFIRGRSDGS
jgi:glutamate--cysteine ligase catalytic subunit